jgi:hypothetical protein
LPPETGAEGWVRHASTAYRLHTKRHDDALADRSAAGPPIAGEWVLPRDTAAPEIAISVHLRPDPQHAGKLALWRYEERRLKNGGRLRDADVAALAQRVAVLEPPLPKNNEDLKFQESEYGPSKLPVLIYHVYWGTAGGEDARALRRLFARFIGFGVDEVIERPHG